MEHRRWRGPERLEESDVGVVGAVSLGRYVSVSESFLLLPEVAWSYSPLGSGRSASGAGVSLRVSAFRVGG